MDIFGLQIDAGVVAIISVIVIALTGNIKSLVKWVADHPAIQPLIAVGVGLVVGVVWGLCIHAALLWMIMNGLAGGLASQGLYKVGDNILVSLGRLKTTVEAQATPAETPAQNEPPLTGGGS
ncbi:MAG: hypothetical protein ABFD92_00010 [Planctomycetaceae bacterium]|nr:hypothetical protein [Planctomycetaceae bacterium]